MYYLQPYSNLYWVSTFVLNHSVELLITFSHGVFSAVFYLVGMITFILQNRKKISGRFKDLFSDQPWVWPNHPTLNPSLLSTLSHCLCVYLGMSLGICSVLTVMMNDKTNITSFIPIFAVSFPKEKNSSLQPQIGPLILASHQSQENWASSRS